MTRFMIRAYEKCAEKSRVGKIYCTATVIVFLAVFDIFFGLIYCKMVD